MEAVYSKFLTEIRAFIPDNRVYTDELRGWPSTSAIC